MEPATTMMIVNHKTGYIPTRNVDFTISEPVDLEMESTSNGYGYKRYPVPEVHW
jgi:hypothetical protein